MSFNKAIIVGHLGRDPELKFSPQGTAICTFTMATTEKRGEKEDTTWFTVTLWGAMAENASKYLAKGRQVYIEGRLTLEEWTDREGRQRHTLKVNGTDMKFIGGAPEKREERSSTPAEEDDSPPF